MICISQCWVARFRIELGKALYNEVESDGSVIWPVWISTTGAPSAHCPVDVLLYLDCCCSPTRSGSSVGIELGSSKRSYIAIRKEQQERAYSCLLDLLSRLLYALDVPRTAPHLSREAGVTIPILLVDQTTQRHDLAAVNPYILLSAYRSDP
jgi:hypothetical protein